MGSTSWADECSRSPSPQPSLSGDDDQGHSEAQDQGDSQVRVARPQAKSGESHPDAAPSSVESSYSDPPEEVPTLECAPPLQPRAASGAADLKPLLVTADQQEVLMKILEQASSTTYRLGRQNDWLFAKNEEKMRKAIDDANREKAELAKECDRLRAALEKMEVRDAPSGAAPAPNSTYVWFTQFTGLTHTMTGFLLMRGGATGPAPRGHHTSGWPHYLRRTLSLSKSPASCQTSISHHIKSFQSRCDCGAYYSIYLYSCLCNSLLVVRVVGIAVCGQNVL